MGVDGFGKQGFADPCLPYDYEGLSICGEVRDSRLKPYDRMAAAYDLDGVQNSGPGERDQFEESDLCRQEPVNSPRGEVSWTLWVPWTRKRDYLKGR
jgi:hypothetical protein